jgi:malate dehydrogenase (quinone)
MSAPPRPVDVVLIGGGIMSATLAVLINRLEPDWSVAIYERLSDVALESSGPWNNAGTGHAALCELNYMAEAADGSVSAEKAVEINEQFQVSRQFWAHLVAEGALGDPHTFINAVPHMTFVRGKKDGDYLRRRVAVLKNEPLFEGIEYSEDRAVIAQWVPALIEGRPEREDIAVTRFAGGTDVDFGSLTHQLIDNAVSRGAELFLDHEVTRLTKESSGAWRLRVRDRVARTSSTVSARFVFVGAGGGALHLLQKAGIPEIGGFGGFPISGRFLRTQNPDVVSQHGAKVYGKAAIGAPPMSVPHLDTRVVDGRASLLFGPYAGFNPKFLKRGSWFDLPASVRAGNLGPMLAVARDNTALIRYLIGELVATKATQFAVLREFMPTADPADWNLITAGQRVQVIKKDSRGRGVLQFGTELIVAADGSIAGLLGASPGASTAVPTMFDTLARCFPDRWSEWEPQLREFVPSLGVRLSDNPTRARSVVDQTAAILKIAA